MSAFTFESAYNLAADAAYALRVELSFMAVFAFLWLVGSAFGSQKKAAKKVSCNTPKKISPPVAKHESSRVTISNGPISSIPATKLKDANWVCGQIQQLCHSQVRRAMELYRASLQAGIQFESATNGKSSSSQTFSSLLIACLRAGQVEDSIEILQDLRRHGPAPDKALIASMMRLCTSKQLFAEGLKMFDLASEGAKIEIDDKTVWSCLLFCSVESKSFRRCQGFFQKLCACGTPSSKDYSNMVRVAFSTTDWKLALKMVAEMQKSDLEITGIVYNTALACCVAGEKLDEARQLLDSIVEAAEVADVITYNTLAKGYAKAGRMKDCFSIYEKMRERGVAPSQVTYGILLDALINDNEVDKAVEIFQTMKKDGCEPNTVLYTTLIKGFARAGQVDQAVELYTQMQQEKQMQPDVITFSILIKAHCDAGRLEAALKLLMSMMEAGLKPDEVVYNNLLSGCIQDCNVELANNLYAEMIKAKVKPTVATFSILLRLYAQCKKWDEAIDLLKTQVKSQGVPAEPRLYGQLVQSCLRNRQGKRACEVYQLLCETSVPTISMNSFLLSVCAKLNMLETSAEIMTLAAGVKSSVDSRDAALLLETAMKKKKPQVLADLKKAMALLNLPLGPA
mmetsp:Transcript_74181/g.131164  ORF Transcript_74181/g.131164 Transcript_74181/m.131164 type:complete len:625 (+) Transcript_74181:141-2015(+)